MNAKQLQRFLDDGGLSQRGAARELAISERTMRRYVAGELPVPRSIELALRYLERRPVNIESLTAEEQETVNDARRDIREHRPGKRSMTVIPMRNAVGDLVEIRFIWADSPARLMAGKAVKQRDGLWETEIT